MTTNTLKDPRQERLADVVYEEDPSIRKKRSLFEYWIDYAHVEQVIPMFVVIISLVLLFPAVFSTISDTKTHTWSRLVPLSFDSPDTSLNVDLSFDQLSPYKKFIDVKASFVRESIDKAKDTSVSINYKVKLLDRLTTTGTTKGSIKESLTFESGEGETSPVSLIIAGTNRSYNVMDFLATVQCDNTDVQGMRVMWTTADQKTYQFLTYGMLSLLGLAAVCFHSYAITFTYFLYLENIMSMVLFGAAVAAVNPLLYVFNIDIQFVNVFLEIFLIVTKFHALYKFREVKVVDDGVGPNTAVCVFMLMYMSVCCYASIAHENSVILGLPMQISEFMRMLFHILFGVLCYYFIWRVKLADEGAHELRVNALVTMVTIVIATEAVSDIVLPILGIAQDTLVCDLLKATCAYGYVMGFSMFFKRKLKRYGINPFDMGFMLDEREEEGSGGATGTTLLDDE